jgi:hypothetical protein
MSRRGAEARAVPSQSGWTAAHAAAYSLDIITVRRVRDCGADFDVQDKVTPPMHGRSCDAAGRQDGQTPLQLAAAHGSESVVSALIGYGVSLDKANKARRPHSRVCLLTSSQMGYTPLHAAAENSHMPVVRLLVEAKATVDAVAVVRTDPRCGVAALANLCGRTAQDGSTPFVMAAWFNQPAVVKYLSSKGADVNRVCEVARASGVGRRLRGHAARVRHRMATVL